MSQHPLPSLPYRRSDIETHLMPDGSSLLYDAATGEAHTLDVVGSFVWEYCDGTLAPDQIAAELAAALPESPDIHAVALRLLAEFEMAGLLASPPETSAAGTADITKMAATSPKENR